jgi:hypothetical protein
MRHLKPASRCRPASPLGFSEASRQSGRNFNLYECEELIPLEAGQALKTANGGLILNLLLIFTNLLKDIDSFIQVFRYPVLIMNRQSFCGIICCAFFFV